MGMLHCLTLRLILCGADLWAWDVTVLDKRLPTDLHSHLLCSRTVFDEAVLSEILITLFLLLGLISSFIACGASLVVAVVTGDLLIILRLLHHLNLVNAPWRGRYRIKVCPHIISLLHLSCRALYILGLSEGEGVKEAPLLPQILDPSISWEDDSPQVLQL